MDILDPLVAAIGYGVGVFLEMHPGVLEQCVVVGFAFSEVCTHYFTGLFVDHYLALGGVSFLLA